MACKGKRRLKQKLEAGTAGFDPTAKGGAGYAGLYSGAGSILGSVADVVEDPKDGRSSVAGGALKMGGQGAAMGATVGGPLGALIGGAGGAIAGAFTAKKGNDRIDDAIKEQETREAADKTMASYRPMINTQTPIYENGTPAAQLGGGTAVAEVEKDELIMRKNSLGKFDLVGDMKGGKTHTKGGEDVVLQDGDVVFPGKMRNKVRKMYAAKDHIGLETARLGLPSEADENGEFSGGIKSWFKGAANEVKDSFSELGAAYSKVAGDIITGDPGREIVPGGGPNYRTPAERLLQDGPTKKQQKLADIAARTRAEVNAAEAKAGINPNADAENYSEYDPNKPSHTAGRLLTEKVPFQVGEIAEPIAQSDSIDMKDAPVPGPVQPGSEFLYDNNKLQVPETVAVEDVVPTEDVDTAEPTDNRTVWERAQGGDMPFSTSAPKRKASEFEGQDNFTEDRIPTSTADDIALRESAPTPTESVAEESATDRNNLDLNALADYAPGISNIIKGLSGPEKTKRRYVNPKAAQYTDMSEGSRDEIRRNAKVERMAADQNSGGSSQNARARKELSSGQAIDRLKSVNATEAQRADAVNQYNLQSLQQAQAQNIDLFNQYEEKDLMNTAAADKFVQSGLADLYKAYKTNKNDARKAEIEDKMIELMKTNNFEFDEDGKIQHVPGEGDHAVMPDSSKGPGVTGVAETPTVMQQFNARVAAKQAAAREAASTASTEESAAAEKAAVKDRALQGIDEADYQRERKILQAEQKRQAGIDAAKKIDDSGVDRIFASGKYQTIPDTLQMAVDAGIIDAGATYGKAEQEIVGDWLVTTKAGDGKVGSYLDGNSTIEQAADALAMEWAGLPMSDGKSNYGNGNKAHVTREKVLAALEEAKATGSVDGIKELIAGAESKGNYDIYNQGTKDDSIVSASKTSPHKVSEMTVEEILKLS